MKTEPLRIALVVPHILMQKKFCERVIFSPGDLAICLADGLIHAGHEVKLFVPGFVDTIAQQTYADTSNFRKECSLREYDELTLLQKHPLVFLNLARQCQSSLIAQAFSRANAGEFDLVHIYTNEEDVALPFAQFCQTPVVFTHHDPFDFLIKYKHIFPKYKKLPWLAISEAQKKAMPADTNWLATIPHGIDRGQIKRAKPEQPYLAYVGRIVEQKGVHLAISAVKKYNDRHPDSPLQLRIAGKHYADNYWPHKIVPELDDCIIYEGFVSDGALRDEFLANAEALVIPSTFEEPFGLVMIEALAQGTPIIGLDSGAIPEVVNNGTTGKIIAKRYRAKELDELTTAEAIARVLEGIDKLDRDACRRDYESRFTAQMMVQRHIDAYRKAIKSQGLS